MNKIYFSSDLHLFHNREFIYTPRGFNSVYEMNEQILNNFNEVMDWTDELYILGDCFLNDNEQGMKYMKRLPGTKHIIWGNHDTDARKELMQEAGFICHGYADVLKYNGYNFYLSHYPTITSNLDNDKKLKHRVINLFGHTHSKNKFYEGRPFMYNVAVDAHNCYPVEIETIITDIKKEIDDCFKAV